MSVRLGGNDFTVWVVHVSYTDVVGVALSVDRCVWSGGMRSAGGSTQGAMITWVAALGRTGDIVLDSAAAAAAAGLYHALVYGRIVRPTTPAVRISVAGGDSSAIATLGEVAVADDRFAWRVAGRSLSGAPFVFTVRKSGVVAEWREAER